MNKSLSFVVGLTISVAFSTGICNSEVSAKSLSKNPQAKLIAQREVRNTGRNLKRNVNRRRSNFRRVNNNLGKNAGTSNFGKPPSARVNNNRGKNVKGFNIGMPPSAKAKNNSFTGTSNDTGRLRRSNANKPWSRRNAIRKGVNADGGILGTKSKRQNGFKNSDGILNSKSTRHNGFKNSDGILNTKHKPPVKKGVVYQLETN